MKLFSKVADWYTKFINNKIPPSLRKSNFFFIALMALSIPVTILMANQVQDLRQRADYTPSSTVIQPTPVTEYAASFNGDSSRIEIAPFSALTFSAPVTFEAWTLPQPPTNTWYDEEVVMASIEASTAAQCRSSFKIAAVASNSTSGMYRYVANFFINNTQYRVAEDPIVTTLEYGKWSHIATTIDENNLATLYVNGQKLASKTLPSSLCNPGKGIVYGAASNGTTAILRTGFNGYIDNIRVSNSIRYRENFAPPSQFSTDSNTVILNDFNTMGTIPNAKVLDGVTFVTSNSINPIPSPSTIQPSPILSLIPTPTKSVLPTPTPTISKPVMSPTPTPPAKTPTPTPKISPQPTGVCKPALLNSYTPYTTCVNGYRYTKFTCSDGFSSSIGTSTSCKTAADWKAYAATECNKRRVCPPSPTPTPKITISCDINGDKKLSSLDYQALMSCINNVKTCTSTQRKNSDLNKDGKVNYVDQNFYNKYCVNIPSPTPTKACKTGVNSFGTDVPCGNGKVRGATYTCYDGVTGKLGDSSSCKTVAEWQQLAQQACAGHTSCK